MARRRRRNTRDGALFKIAVILSILVAIIISIGAGSGSGRFDLKVFLIVFIISLVLFLTLFIVLSVPSVKGKIGEHRVSKKLQRLAKKYGGYVINDVMIPGDNGKTSQIDHIYISEYGVFVIETKNYAGRIYGTDDQLNWTQVLVYGNTKNKLYSPVKQNQTHIIRLKEILKSDVKEKVELYSVIVFVKANIDHVDSSYVYSIRDIKYLIDSDDEKEITPETVENIYAAIKEYKDNPVKTNKEHIKEIKQMKKDVDNNICPRCGGMLVQRTSKDGYTFFGCSNYPKCRFTKKQ